MNALREIFARFGVVFDQEKNVQKGAKDVDGLVDKITDLGNTLMGAAIVVGVRNFVGSIVQMGRDVDLTRQRLGLSAEEVQAWGLAAQSAGRQADDFVDAISTLQERARDAILDPKSDPALQLRLLGVEARRADGSLKSGQELILDVADAMQNMESDTDRVGAAMTLFGDVGRELLPVLRQGRGGFEQYRDMLRELGGGVSEDAIEASREMARSQARLSVAALSLKSRLSVILIPALARTAEVLARVGGAFSDLAKRGRLLELVFIAAGVAAVASGRKAMVAWLRAAAPIAALIAVVGVAILVFEDIWLAIEGGQSVIKDLSMEVVRFARTSMGDGPLGVAILAWEYFVGVLESAAQIIASITGAEIPLPSRHEIARDAESPEQRELAEGVLSDWRESAGWLEALVPDSFEHAAALSSASQSLRGGGWTPEMRRALLDADRARQGAISAGPTVNNVTVQANTNASPREIAREVERVLDRQNAEALDALGQSGGE